MVICMTRYQLYELRDNYISMDTLNPEQSNENVQVHATTQEQWKCDRCPATFRNKALLARHKSQLHRPVKKYNCCHCGEGFNSAANFAIHRAVHNQKLFKCPRCALVFRRHATLVGHIELHYVGEENICAVCDREFQSLDELKAHIYEGHEKNMKKPAQPKINIIRKSGKETFQCTLCDNKVFPKRSALERHFLTHTKQKPFVCDTCGKSFNQKCSLKMHTLVHSKIQKHVCALCGLKFSQKANLRVHTFRVHPKRTPSLADRLPCPYCPSLFKNLGSLNGHKTRVHASVQSEHAKKNETSKTEDAPPAHRLDTDQIIQNTGQGIVYKCGTCEEDFYDLPQLRRHMETHVPSTNRHDERPVHHVQEVIQPIVHCRRQDRFQGPRDQRPHGCTICPAAFKQSSHLKQHIKSHYGIKGNRCEICNKTFTTTHTLKVHRNSHSQNSQLHYKCSQCPAWFSLQSSLRRHTKLHENPDQSFKCPYCNRIFKWLQNCKTHMRISHSEVAGEKLTPIPMHGIQEVAKENMHTIADNHSEVVHMIDELEETMIDLSNLPSDVSIVDIRSFTNCIVKINDQLYEIPFQIETNQGEEGVPKEQQFIDSHDAVQQVSSTLSCTDNSNGEFSAVQANTSKPPIVETVKLETSDPSALYQYVNESSNDVSTASTEDNALSDHANITEGNVQRVPIKDIKWRPKSRSIIIPDKTAEELFSEVTEDGQKKYVCTGCNKGFKQSVDLRRHIRTHTGHSASIDDITLNDHANSTEGHRRNVSMQNKAWQGQPKSTSSKLLNKTEEELFSHVLEDGRKKYVCTGCNRVFRKPIDLRRHIRTHTGERPFKCDKCERAFVLKGVLDVHKKTHDALREKMSCSEPGCTSQFTSKAGLKLHLRIHTGDRPFECTICDLTFRTSGHLQAHMTAHLRIVAKKRQRYETWAFGK